MMSQETLLLQMHVALEAHFGFPKVQSWSSPLEATLAVVLAQGNKWRGAEAAIALFKERGPLTLAHVGSLSSSVLEACCAPAGSAMIKAKTLRNLFSFFAASLHGTVLPEDAQLDFLAHESTDSLREQLVSVRGIGAETADALLFFSLSRPVFMAGSSIYRILRRHGFMAEDASHAELRDFFMDALPQNQDLYASFSALLRETARKYCKTGVLHCAQCPLHSFLEYDPEL